MDRKQIKISPRVIKHLGKDLITSSEVAVVELIKNSLDAKANTVCLSLFEDGKSVKAAEHFICPVLNEMFSFIPAHCFDNPLLVVEDDGKGMDDYQLDKGFLEIGTDMKLTESGESTLGEKGIGRLAVQRLGKYLLVETASKMEPFGTLTFIDWDDITKTTNSNYFVPYQRFDKSRDYYTRLWIFGVNIADLMETPAQLMLHFDDSNLLVNRELKSAINFLISPFAYDTKSTNIEMYYNDIKLDISFPQQMLRLSESTHRFEVIEKNGELNLEYELELKPWYIERIHRALVKPEAFNKLKKEHKFYENMLNNNESRIKNVLQQEISQNNLFTIITEFFENVFELGISNKEKRHDFSEQRAGECINALKKIIPISGKIFSFKQNSAIGEKIIIDSVKELENETADFSLKILKEFLKDYNGIKLYRNIYRIGFLGDKENDWIKLQQYRTKGQQWYRFDLGNTLGYVSIKDPDQKNIQEISSRLDINQNEVSDSFKIMIGIIFNDLFYELNRKANDIIKVILEENSLLGESLAKRVKKNTSKLEDSLKKNKRILSEIQNITNDFVQNTKIEGENAYIPTRLYKKIEKVFQDTSAHFEENEKNQSQAVDLLAEADEQLKAIEIESYNNYKLMANGLITETITHELHSISKTGVDTNIGEHFEFLKDYFITNSAVKIYNNHVHPVQTSYSIIADKISDIGNLYSFLENTFIKKGTYDEFVLQNIKEVIQKIEQNLIKVIRDNNMYLNYERIEGMVWFVPKGVLIHVFYNLFNNSIYWIDKRRKYAESDIQYAYSGRDEIVIEEYGNDIVIYDTGTGVLKAMEDILFEPLESGKPNQEGRGMGLYIVKKILNSFNANIELLLDRNTFGNRYKFLISMKDEEE